MSVIELLKQAFTKQSYEMIATISGERGVYLQKRFDQRTEHYLKRQGIADPLFFVRIWIEQSESKNPLGIEVDIGLCNKIQGEMRILSEEDLRGLRSPISFEVRNEITFDWEGSRFLFDGKAYKCEELVSLLYKVHTRPYLWVKGTPIRLRRCTNRIIMHFSSIAYRFMRAALWIVNGHKIKMSEENLYIDKRAYEGRGYKLSEDKSSDIEFFGLKVMQHSIFVYSLFHMMAYVAFCFMKVKPDIIRYVLTYPLLTVAYVVVSFVLFDKILPKSLIKSIEVLAEINYSSRHSTFKINI